MADLRRALLAKAHIAKKDLGLGDDVYRTILWTRFDVNSAGELNNRQLDDLLGHFEQLGWRPVKRPGKSKPKAAPDRAALVGKIEALLAELAKAQGTYVPWSYAVAICKRQGGPDKLEWATPAQLRGVVAALAKQLDRVLDRVRQKGAQA